MMPRMPEDLPPPRESLSTKINSGMQQEARDSTAAWIRAQRRGWTRAEFDHWVATDKEPIRSVERRVRKETKSLLRRQHEALRFPRAEEEWVPPSHRPEED